VPQCPRGLAWHGGFLTPITGTQQCHTTPQALIVADAGLARPRAEQTVLTVGVRLEIVALTSLVGVRLMEHVVQGTCTTEPAIPDQLVLDTLLEHLRAQVITPVQTPTAPALSATHVTVLHVVLTLVGAVLARRITTTCECTKMFQEQCLQ